MTTIISEQYMAEIPQDNSPPKLLTVAVRMSVPERNPPPTYKLRFYGSCGHVTTSDVWPETFARYAAPRVVKSIFGDFEEVAQTTEEDGAFVVHVYPDRFFLCENCLRDDLNDDDLT